MSQSNTSTRTAFIFVTTLFFLWGIHYRIGRFIDPKNSWTFHLNIFWSWIGTICFFWSLFCPFHSRRCYFIKDWIQKRHCSRTHHHGDRMFTILSSIFFQRIFHLHAGIFYAGWRNYHITSCCQSIRCSLGFWDRSFKPIELVASV